MKALILSLIVTFSILSHAEDNARLSAVKAADKTRVTAMQTADRDQLTTIFSDELRYAHSTGVVDTKTSLIDVLTSGKTKYVGYDYEEQSFTFPAPGIALMSGRAHVKAETANGTMDSVLSFLAVWREEKGQWKFLAWQSCKLPPATK